MNKSQKNSLTYVTQHVIVMIVIRKEQSIVEENKMLSIESFINDKVRSYIAPEKEGVPKGNKIGLSLEKHHASLLLLRIDSLKEIASKVKAPYGTVRNWKKDLEFKRSTSEYADEFANEFIDILDKRISKLHKKLPTILQIKDLKKLPINIERELEDVKDYSKYLSVKLFKKLWKLCLTIMPYQDANGEDMQSVLNRARQQSTSSKKADIFYFNRAPLDENQLAILVLKLDGYVSALDILFNVAKLESQNISLNRNENIPVRHCYKLLHECVMDYLDIILQKDGAIEEKERKYASYFLLLARRLYKDTTVN